MTWAISGDVLSFTVTTEPGFTYAAEGCDDLVTWEPLGSVLCEGNTLELSFGVDQARLFFRFYRVP